MITKGNLLPTYNLNLIRGMLSLQYKEVKLPELKVEELLIKTSFASINPSDIAFMQGVYGIQKKLPVIPGFEGSGIVIDAGEKVKHLIGQKVAAFVQQDQEGTWAEHFIAKQNDIVLLKDDFPLEKAAMIAINPFTAYGLMEKVEVFETKAIIQNAAGGMVAKWIQVLAKEKGIPLINIVRKQEQQSQLSKHNEYVLNSSSVDFESDLNKLSKSLNANFIIDAVAGEESAVMLNSLPKNRVGKLLIYGGLSGKKIANIDPIKIIFHQKSIEGFNLVQWKKEKSTLELQNISKDIQLKINSSPHLFEINTTFAGDQIKMALKTYIKNMSLGKVLLKF
jgi:NADPH:quinone reductase-like Zn-dependent oxidoreductase